jgi:MFS family permease
MRGRTEAEGRNQIQTRSGRSQPEPACVPSGTVGRHATADAGRSSVKRSLGRAYRLLWISNGASAVGTGMTITAIPLVAAVGADSEVVLGVVAAAGILPGLLFAVPAGMLTDRVDRRMLLVASDLLRAVVVALALVAVALDVVGSVVLALTTFLVGVGETVFVSASQALVPSVVDSADLDEANGRLQAAEDSGREFIGPPLGSWAFSLVHWLPFAADAITYVASAAVLWRLPRAASAPDTAADATDDITATTTVPVIGDAAVDEPIPTGMADAWLFFRGSRTLIVLGLSMFVLAMSGAAVLALMVLVIREQLAIGGAWYGPALAVLALGATIAGLAAGRLRRLVAAKPAMISAVGLNAISYLVLGSTHFWPVGLAALALWGFAVTFGNITSVGIRQRTIPSALLGRTMGLFRTSLGAGGLIGALAGGALAASTSSGTVAVVAGLVQLPVVVLLAVGLPARLGEHRALSRLRAL